MIVQTTFQIELLLLVTMYLSSRFLEMIGYDKNDIQINAFDYWKDKTHPEDYDKVMEEA